MKKFFKQLLCRHDWQVYKINGSGLFQSISGERRCLACKKCEKIKKGSEYSVKYEGMGFK